MNRPFVQKEYVRDEGTWYSIDGFSYVQQKLVDDAGIETHFCGRGASGKVHKAAKVISKLLGVEVMPHV